MNWHAQTERPESERTVTESMAVAYANLLQKFDVDASPIFLQEKLESDERPLDWATFTSIQPRLMPTHIGEAGTWPISNLSIVRFNYLRADNQMTDHYCVIANPANHTIIDSYDGNTHYATTYGEPTSWATYTMDEPDDTVEPDESEDTPVTITPRVRTGIAHNVVTGENIWRLAAMYKLTVDEILEHNQITDANSIKPRDTVYIPVDKASKTARPISYEILERPRLMHVTPLAGAKKWSFGNVRTWKDVQFTGQNYSQNKNLTIVAIAHVPIEGDVAAYYMESNALGDYSVTGLVKYMIGYNWQHLADGHVYPDFVSPDATIPAVNQILDPETVEIIETALAQQDTVEVPPPEPDPMPAEPPKEDDRTDEYKTTYAPFPEPVDYNAIEWMTIIDFSGKHPARPIRADQPVKVAGTFRVGQDTYGLPVGCIRKKDDGSREIFMWYGVPANNLYIEDKMYNTEVTALADKIALRKPLSLDEHVTVFISKNMAKLERLKAIIKRKK